MREVRGRVERVRGPVAGAHVITVRDDAGVVHAIYNQLEVRQLHARHALVEGWQVRTLCHKYESVIPSFDAIRRVELDFAGASAPTCVQCAALECDHGITFDENMAKSYRMTSNEIRSRWPRLEGTCTKGCGYHGIAYASHAHYVYGDW